MPAFKEEEEFFNHRKNDLKRHKHTLWVEGGGVVFKIGIAQEGRRGRGLEEAVRLRC
jgi:hypothetical protein